MSDVERSKGRNIALWVVSGLLALAYLAAGGSKLADPAAAGEGFARFGYPEGMALLIGACELAGAVGLLIPRLAGLAASGLVIIMLGAVYSHAIHDPLSQALAPLVLGLLCGYVAWERGLPLGGGAASASPTG